MMRIKELVIIDYGIIKILNHFILGFVIGGYDKDIGI